jgi:hypothetical protein
MARHGNLLMVIAGYATDADDLRSLLGALNLLAEVQAEPATSPQKPKRQKPERLPPTLLAICGTRHGYQKHIRLGQDPCGPCAGAARDYSRERYQTRFAHPRDLAPCGTEAAYQRHRRAGQRCGDCTAANAKRSRDRRARLTATT